MMANNWLTTIGTLVSALPQTKDKEETKDPKTTSTTDAEKLNAAYEKIAKNLMQKYDTDSQKGILSATEMQASPFFGVNEDNRTKIVGVLAQGQGMTLPELTRLVLTWDTNPADGKLTPEEEEAGRKSILDKLKKGTNPEKIFAQQEALALKLGAKVSDAKMKELEALFEKHGIPKKDYTPETTETESNETTKTKKGSSGGIDWGGIIQAVIGLFSRNT